MASAKSTRRGERAHGGCLLVVYIAFTYRSHVSTMCIAAPTAVWSSTSKSHHTQAREDPAVVLTAGVALCAAAACRKTSIW